MRDNFITQNTALFTSKRQDWATPKWLFDELNLFDFKLDPCCTKETAKCINFFTSNEDGLKQEWTLNSFVNPPFAREISEWIEKGYKEHLKFGITVGFLIPARVDTLYWHKYCFRSDIILFIKGRIKFEKPNSDTPKEKWVSAPFPSAFVLFGYKGEDLSSWSRLGKVFEVKK